MGMGKGTIHTIINDIRKYDSILLTITILWYTMEDEIPARKLYVYVIAPRALKNNS
jgi:hypothetical protein